MPDQSFQDIVDARFKELPPVLQEAITGAHVQDHMQKLAKKHELHLDQWQKLENQVVLTLMGLASAEGLRDAIKHKVGVTDAVADELAEAIALEVFDPVRKELERTLSHPSAKAEEGTPIEDLTDEIMRASKMGAVAPADPEIEPVADLPSIAPDMATPITPGAPTTTPVTPTATPAPPATAEPVAPKPTVTRAPISDSYTPGNLSNERKDVHSDPYRIAPDAA